MERGRRHPWAQQLLVLAGAATVLFSVLVQLAMYPVFHVQRTAIRHHMKHRILAGLPASALTTFRFTPQELAKVHFVDGGRELRHEGVLHDIARVYHDGHGQVVVEALRDDRETRLMADLGRMVERRVAQDADGRTGRLVLMAGWAAFCEPWPAEWSVGQPSQDRPFMKLATSAGRQVGAIDPGPPRRA